MARLLAYLRLLGFSIVGCVLMTSQTMAQSCMTDAVCGGTGLCIGAFFFVPGECVPFACRSNRQCFSELPTCIGGICRRVGGRSTSGSAGTATPAGGVGGVCGEVTLGGGITKHIGCQRGLQCRFGRCERLPP
jgi:hypothetical protein